MLPELATRKQGADKAATGKLGERVPYSTRVVGQQDGLTTFHINLTTRWLQATTLDLRFNQRGRYYGKTVQEFGQSRVGR